MRYRYECINPECSANGDVVVIQKPMSECSRVEFCESCGEVIERTMDSLVCGMSVDNTGDFYRKVN
jgi:hypothetical protein